MTTETPPYPEGPVLAPLEDAGAGLLRRFLAKIAIGDDCWDWAAGVSSGYGSFWFEGRNQPAHRVSYELFVGPIPAGTEIDHLCRNTLCVRPDHLEATSHRENIRRGSSPAQIAAFNRSRTHRKNPKTHCNHGHEFSPENTYVYSGARAGWRACRSCAQRLRAERRLRMVAR